MLEFTSSRAILNSVALSVFLSLDLSDLVNLLLDFNKYNVNTVVCEAKLNKNFEIPIFTFSDFALKIY